mgnify:CR=1 FL=1
MIEDFNKRQRVIDLGEEAEDKILKPTVETDSAFNTPQYRRVMAANKERDKSPTQAWIPDEEKCVHSKLHDAQDELVNFEEDSEYKNMFDQHTDAMQQQSELIERWVEQEEKRLPPKPPMSPYE